MFLQVRCGSKTNNFISISWGFECGGLRNAKNLTTMEQESLNKTWFIDIDGTIVKTRNNEQLDEAINSMGDESYLIEEPIEKSVNFIQSIPFGDTIVLTTARDSRHEGHTLKMLKHFRIRYDRILFDLRSGARVLINDICLLYTSPSPRDKRQSRMPSSA